jgi:hypothetical protein
MGFKPFSVDPSALFEHMDGLDWKSIGGVLDAVGMVQSWPERVPVDEVVGQVLWYYPGARRGMTMFSKLVPGQVIEAHRDFHDEGCRRRVHVPITTNQRAFFWMNGEAINMQVGQAYEIDPTALHAAVNMGATERTHLIFNVL